MLSPSRNGGQPRSAEHFSDASILVFGAKEGGSCTFHGYVLHRFYLSGLFFTRGKQSQIGEAELPRRRPMARWIAETGSVRDVRDLRCPSRECALSLSGVWRYLLGQALRSCDNLSPAQCDFRKHRFKGQSDRMLALQASVRFVGNKQAAAEVALPARLIRR